MASTSTVRIGDLTVNRLGFGAMRVCGTHIWGPPMNRAAAHALLRKAYDLGLNFFDTTAADPPQRRTRARDGLIVLLPVLLAFAGCMVGPDYQRPKVSVSPSFGETGDQRVRIESTTYRDWWRAFNDPAL